MGHQFINFNFQKKELYQYKQTFRHCFLLTQQSYYQLSIISFHINVIIGT